MSERRHRILFEHAPIALWNVDLDQMSGASPGPAAGAPAEVAAWAIRLAEHPDELRALAAAVVVRDANQRARALAGGAPDLAALLAHLPAASGSRMFAAMAVQRAFAEETTWHAGTTAQQVRITFDRLDDAGHAFGLVGVAEVAAAAGNGAVVTRLEQALAGARAELSGFVYAASHDLQGPLRMVVGYTDLLARRYGDALDERATKYIEQAGHGARQMRDMLDGLLVLSRVFTGPHTRAAVDVAALLTEAQARLRTQIADSGARITHDDALPTVTGDPRQLVQVVEQLLDNAIKFHGDEPPAIHIGARRAHDGWVLSVTDNGIGMESERIGAIFSPFQRLHPPHTYPGTGLGLTVVAKIIERHGGQVWATSQPDQGATLHVSLPDSPA